ncbi:hypothetical protein KFK09_010529 [Dendrobium nobile]|uniref:Uncharacterized protein n=1 Tax=Dendrobium nobile TaxID=94219 RepID=A0A8T3BA90_DENNO|nr:hypothetical protein KFK09_010529 [Dendrobium nobile]
MPRQSLGSPSSKLQIHGCSGNLNQEEKQVNPSSPESEYVAAAESSSEYKLKTEKMIRSTLKTSRSIHLIPFLTLLCLLILYLCSHDPDPKGIDGIDMGGLLGPEKIGTAIGSRRALKKAGRWKIGNA